jgi:hypothetical protein
MMMMMMMMMEVEWAGKRGGIWARQAGLGRGGVT